MKSYVLCFLVILLVPAVAVVPCFSKAPTQNQSWAGYIVQTNFANPQQNKVTDIKGSWTVPAVQQESGYPFLTNSSSCWIGIDGWGWQAGNDGTIAQIGTESDIVMGDKSYYAWYEMWPGELHKIDGMTITPGDKMSAEVKYLSRSGGLDKFSLSITDTSTPGVPPFSIQLTLPNKSQGGTHWDEMSSGEWIVENPFPASISYQLANFGSVQFTDCQVTVDGVTGSIDPSTSHAWQYAAVTMTTNGLINGIVEAQPSPLGSDRGSFSVEAYPPFSVGLQMGSGSISAGGTIHPWVYVLSTTGFSRSVIVSVGGASSTKLWYYNFTWRGVSAGMWRSTYLGKVYSPVPGMTYILYANATLSSTSVTPGHADSFGITPTVSNYQCVIPITGTALVNGKTYNLSCTFILTVL